MTYGLVVKNDYGNVIIDDVYPQFKLIASGAASAADFSNLGTHTTTVSVNESAPFTFVRAPMNCFFSVYRESSTGFTYRSEGQLDWKTFANTLGSSQSGYGLKINNGNGLCIFNSLLTPPFLMQRTFINSSEVNPQTTASFIKTIYFSTTAYDGGLPYISATSLGLASIVAGPAMYLVYSIAAKFTSTNSLDLYIKPVYGGGSPYPYAEVSISGAFPRAVIFSK